MAEATCLMVDRTQLCLVRFLPRKFPELKKVVPPTLEEGGGEIQYMSPWETFPMPAVAVRKREGTKFWILGRALCLETGAGVWDEGGVSWQMGGWGEMRVRRALGRGTHFVLRDKMLLISTSSKE